MNTLGAETYAGFGISIVLPRQIDGVARQVLQALRSRSVSCESRSMPNEKDQNRPVLTMQMLVVAAVDPRRSCLARKVAVSSLYWVS